MKLFISVLLISLSAHSQVSISNTIYRFLDHQYGIRSASLSGANLAVDNSISDVLVNPASLRVENESIGFSLASYLLDTKYGQISYNHPLELGQSLALSVFALVSNSFELRQEDGVLIGDYSVSDFAVSISLIDQNLLDDFAFAITGKLVQSRIESFNSSAILFDFSTYIKAASLKNHQFAFQIRNIGFQLKKYSQADESLPLSLSLGYSYRLAKAPITLMLVFPHMEAKAPFEKLSLGTEIEAHSNLALRVSYDRVVHDSYQLRNERNLFAGFSAGIGLHMESHQFDFAYTNHSFLGNLISVSYQKTFD